MKRRKPKIKKYRFIPVYEKLSKPRKTRLAFTRKKRGIYIIREQKGYYRQKPDQRRKNKGELVYVGFSAKDLYRTIMRHFGDKWTDEKQTRVNYGTRLKINRYTIKIILFSDKETERQIFAAEQRLIDFYLPRDNTKAAESFFLAYSDAFQSEFSTAPIEDTPDYEERIPPF